MRPSIKIVAQQNVKKIDSVLEPVSNMCEEHKRNEIRRRKLLGEQTAFMEDRVRNMNSSEREKLLNQVGDPANVLKPRYITKEEAGRLTFQEAGGKILKPMSEGITANTRMARPDLSKDKMVERIHEIQEQRARQGAR